MLYIKIYRIQYFVMLLNSKSDVFMFIVLHFDWNEVSRSGSNLTYGAMAQEHCVHLLKAFGVFDHTELLRRARTMKSTTMTNASFINHDT